MFYIYHIPTVKIDCSKQPERRVRAQGYTDYEILEQYEDGWLAGDRELELQREYGYPVDTIHYMKVRRFTDAERSGNDQPKLRKLTMQQAREIRAKYVPYEYSHRKLAKEYGITPTNVKAILDNRTYRE